MSTQTAESWRNRKRLAILLSWPGWVMLFIGFAFDSAPHWLLQAYHVLLFVSCLLCSPVSVVMFIRSPNEIVTKVLLVLWAGVPVLAGVAIALLAMSNIK